MNYARAMGSIGRTTSAISCKPRGDWLWRQVHGPADPSVAAEIVGDSAYWLCHSGRRALHEALRRCPVTTGRTLWIPAFICRGIVPAAEAAGFQVALYDIDDYLGPCAVDARAGDAVLAVHYFGLTQPIAPLREALRARGVTLIEDCAHLLKPGYQGGSAGLVGEWAIFSFRKQLPVTGGGMLIGQGLNARRADTRVSHRLSPKHALPTAERIGQTILGRYYCSLVEWSRAKLDPVRRTDQLRFDDEDAIGATTLRALRSLDINAVAERRRSNYRALSAMLSDVDGVRLPYPDLPPGSIPMVMPVQVQRPAQLATSMCAFGVGTYPWPGFEVLAGVDWRQFPGTRIWLDHFVGLPVHQDLNASDLERVHDSLVRALARKSGW